MEVVIKDFKCLENRTIELSSGATNLLSGNSGSGKTTILEAIVWCLYGGRGVKPSGKKTAITQVSIIYRELLIKRCAPGGLECKNTTTNRRFVDCEAQAYIDRIFQTEEVFRCCSYIKQRTVECFMDLSNKDKYTMFSKICFNGGESIFDLIANCTMTVKKYEEKYRSNILLYNSLKEQCRRYHSEEWNDLNFAKIEDDTELQKLYEEAVSINHFLLEWERRSKEIDDARSSIEEIVLFEEDAEKIYIFMSANIKKISEYRDLLKGVNREELELAIKEYDKLLEYEQLKKLCSSMGITNVEVYNNIPDNYLEIIEELSAQNELYNLLLKRLVLVKRIDAFQIPNDWEEKLETLNVQRREYNEKKKLEKHGSIEDRIRGIEDYDRTLKEYELQSRAYVEYTQSYSTYQAELKEYEAILSKKRNELSELNAQIKNVNNTLGTDIFKEILGKCRRDDDNQSNNMSDEIETASLRSSLRSSSTSQISHDTVLFNLRNFLENSTRTLCSVCSKRLSGNGNSSGNEYQYRDVDSVLNLYSDYVSLLEKRALVENDILSTSSIRDNLEKPVSVRRPDSIKQVDTRILSELRRYQNVMEPSKLEIDKLSMGYELNVLKKKLVDLNEKIRNAKIQIVEDFSEKELQKSMKINTEIIELYKKYSSTKTNTKTIVFPNLTMSPEKIREYNKLHMKLVDYIPYHSYLKYDFRLITKDYNEIERRKKLQKIIDGEKSLGEKPIHVDISDLKRRIEIAQKTKQYKKIKEEYDTIMDQRKLLKEKLNRYNDKIESYSNLRTVTTTFIIDRLSTYISNFSGNVNTILCKILPTISVNISSENSSVGDMGNKLILDIINDKGIRIISHRNLSGGEQNRLALAIAMSLNILVGGKILMTDEVFSSVEERLREECLELLKEEFRDKILIDVTHGVPEGTYDNCVRV